MALKECDKCGGLVTDTNPVCPKCGHKRGQGKKRWEIALTLLVFAGAVTWLWFFQLQDKQQEMVKETLQQIVGQPVTMFDEHDVQIMEGHYRHYKLVLKGDADVTIDYRVQSGPGMDVYFFNTRNFNAWKQQFNQFSSQEYQYLVELSSFGLSESIKSHRVKAGTYYVVFDNTKMGPTKPPDDFVNDIVTLNFKISRTNYK